jgi:hypothetical protein
LAKPLTDLENPVTIERPVYRSPETFGVMYKPEIRCSCGCNEVIVDGFKYDDEYFHTESCVVRMMLSEGWIQRVG